MVRHPAGSGQRIFSMTATLDAALTDPTFAFVDSVSYAAWGRRPG
jgi:hypothetical protein